VYIINSPSSVLFDQNIIVDNNYTSDYGGVRISNSDLNFTNNIVSGNSTSGNYAGLYIDAANKNIVIKNNLISGNTASKGYGGLYVKASTANVFNNVIVNNTALNGHSAGAYFYLNGSRKLYLINNTISKNTSSSNTGGVFFNLNDTSPSIFVYNNIINKNKGTSGMSDINLNGYGNNKLFYNNNMNLDEFGGTGLWSENENPIYNDPGFVDELNGDFHLLATSPCINEGDSNLYTSVGIEIETDKDGNPRINGNNVDIGAYEHTTDILHPADMNEDWVIDNTEFNNYGSAWKKGLEWEKGPNPIPIDYVTRAGYILQSGTNYHNKGGGRPGCWEAGSN
jgi:hypothetical protein